MNYELWFQLKKNFDVKFFYYFYFYKKIKKTTKNSKKNLLIQLNLHNCQILETLIFFYSMISHQIIIDRDYNLLKLQIGIYLFNCTNLKTIIFMFNQIHTKKSNSIFTIIKSWVKQSLSENELRTLHKNSFVTCKNLKELNLKILSNIDQIEPTRFKSKQNFNNCHQMRI